MSLIVTSCTMGKQPDRLLNKGPQYLRTRTNASLFPQNRKSAVELLAASKAQFYNIKTSVDLDKHQDLAVSPEQKERYNGSIKKKQPLRSKSEYDLSQLHLTRVEEDSDENNNDISDDSMTLTAANSTEDSRQSHSQDTPLIQTGESEDGYDGKLSSKSLLIVEKALNTEVAQVTHESTAFNVSEKSQSKRTVFSPLSLTTYSHSNIYENVDIKPYPLKAGTDCTVGKKPIPLPRKLKEKPVPPPRKFSSTAPVSETAKDFNTCISETVTTSSLSHSKAASPLQNSSLSSKHQEPAKTTTDKSSGNANVNTRFQNSSIDSLTLCFKTLNTTSADAITEKSHQPPKDLNSPESVNIYTAKSIFIAQPKDSDTPVKARQITTIKNARDTCQTPTEQRLPETSSVNVENITGRKQFPDVRNPEVSAPTKTVNSEKRSIPSETSDCKPGIVLSLVSRFLTVEKCNSASGSRSEMSIESVDQAVFQSEINAVPAVFMDANHMQEVDEDAREVTRASSSLSGKLEQQNSSPLSMSPTHHCSAVPRSHSDISCHLEGQHSRDSSIVSNHSRLSCASVGTDLENFFNQMGLEKGILDPINRLKELQTSEVFDSMSSLDSHDAASICSTYSRSEQEWSDTQSVERSQQQTSIVERNARIIKWLCNVRKAKNQPQKHDSAAAAGKV